jgi:hypothetical protein
MFMRRRAALVLLAFLGLASVAPAAAQAQRSDAAIKVFTNTHFGYTLSYPAAWRPVPSTNLDILAEAPDSAARVSGKGINGALSTPQLRQVVDVTIGALSTKATILHTARVIHGVPFQVGQTTITTQQGVKELAMVLAASRHQRTFLFFGLVGLAVPAAHMVNPRAQQETGQIQASFASITISR